MAALWCKLLDAGIPPLGSRVWVSVTPFGFRGGWNGDSIGFSRVFSLFPPVINFIPLFLHANLIHFVFHFISSTPVMVCQALSACILANHRPSVKGLNYISSLELALCRTRVEENNKLLFLYHNKIVILKVNKLI